MSCLVRVTCASILLVVGCNEAETAADPARRVSSAAWDTAFVIGGSLQDTTLVRPRLLTAGADGIFVYDYGSASVKAFDFDGRLRWTHGRRGSGPGEFRNPVDIRVAPDGSIWLIDTGAGRLAVLEPVGAERRLIRLTTDAPPQQLVLLDTVSLALLYATDSRFLARLNAAGALDDLLEHPADSLALSNPNLRVVRAGSNGRQWAAAFVFTGSFLVYDGTALVCTGILRDGEALRARGQTLGDEQEVAAGVVVGERDIWVLGIPLDDRDTRFIDEYDLSNCSYTQSYRLPVRARTVAHHDGVFVIGHEEPAPAILGVRVRR